MGNSLFDQLKKSGLVDEKQAKQAKKDKYQQARLHKGKKKQPLDESKRRAQQMQAEKIERDRELNKQQKNQAEKKAIAAQVRQLIGMNRIEIEDADVAFNFSDAGNIERLFVTLQQQLHLASGRLSIVRLDNRYALVPTGVAEKIKLRDASCVVVCNVKEISVDDEDDPYAEFQVPDDLMW